jgi:hypothetical protein
VEFFAHLDEGGGRLPSGNRLYGFAAVLTSASIHDNITEALFGELLPHRPYLHHYDETPERRLKIADTLSALPLSGAIVITEITRNTAQEQARCHLLGELLPRLEHVEKVSQVVLESRSGGDKHDRRTVDRLRRSRHVTGALRLNHASKAAAPLTWIADFLIGSYVCAELHDDPQAWKILNQAHAIDVLKCSR